MKFRVALILSMLVVALAPTTNGAGKKNDKAIVSFHMQAESTDNPKMIFPYVVGGERQFFRRMPDIRTKDIASFTSFPSPHSETEFAVAFRLKKTAANRLRVLTNANQGSWLAAQMNGRVIDCLYIDAPVDDGVLVIWNDVTAGDIATLEKALPRTNEKKK